MDKKILLVFVFGMFFVISCYSVLGAITISVPVDDTNYTTSLSLDVAYTNASADMTDALQANTTCYYNASGTWASVGTLSAFTTSAAGFTATVDLSALNDGKGISFNCTVGNNTLLTNAAMINNIIFDSTAPNITFYNVVSGGYYSDSINFNASIIDATIGMDTVYFNVTNSSGENVTALLSTKNDGDYYSNDSFDTTAYTDGVYNLTVYANDSLGNLNTTAISFTIDNAHPAPSALTFSSATKTSLTITFSGADGTCTADRSGATISDSTLTETDLDCGTSYSYIITCTDTAGNAGSSSATSFSTSACGDAVSTTPPFYTNTYLVSGEQFQQGYTKEIAVKHRAKVKVGANYHHIGVKALTATTATIEIASDPVEVILDVGEEAKIDVTEDGYYDIYVKLIDLVNNKANLLIKEVYEEIPEGEGDIATSGEITDGEEDEEVVETNLTWLWVLIGVLVVAGGLAILLKMKKQKSSGLKKQ